MSDLREGMLENSAYRRLVVYAEDSGHRSRSRDRNARDRGKLPVEPGNITTRNQLGGRHDDAVKIRPTIEVFQERRHVLAAGYAGRIAIPFTDNRLSGVRHVTAAHVGTWLHHRGNLLV